MSFESDGRKMPADTFDGSMIVIKGSAFTSAGMGATYEGTVELDQAKKPKTLDLLFTVGHAAGTRNLGIYKLDGDQWTICLATRGSNRPTGFATRPGTGFALETLARGDAARKARKAKPQPARAASRATKGAVAERDAAQSGAPTALEGEWAMVAGVLNGAALGPDMVKWCQRITRGDVTTVVAPEAPVRILLVADPDARVARREAELGGRVDLAAVTDQVIRRDRDDSTVAQFHAAAPGVLVLDSTHLSLYEVIEAICQLVALKTAPSHPTEPVSS